MATTQTRVPTGDSPTSTANQFSASSGTSKFAVVNDAVGSPNDAGYIFRQTSNGNQRFTFSPFTLPSGASDITIRVTYRSKNQTGAVSHTPRILVGSTESAGTTSTLTSSFTDRFSEWATNPVTGAAWTAADVNGTGSNPLTEFGVGQSGTTAGEEGQVSQVYISATYTPPVTADDTGAGVDSAASPSATITGADAGAGAEGASVSAAVTALADAGASDDAASLSASVANDDAGAGADSASAAAALDAADSAEGVDSAALTSAAVEAADLSVAGDGASVAAGALAADTAEGTDSASASVAEDAPVQVASDDAGAGEDSAASLAFIVAADAGAGVDSARLAAVSLPPLVPSYSAEVEPVASGFSASVSPLDSGPSVTVEVVASPYACEVNHGY